MNYDQESGSEDDEILLKTENVFFYNIPFNINQKPGSLRAKDWDLSNPAGCCTLTVAAAGICCHIHLEDESGQVFGQAVVDFYPGDFGSSSVVSAVSDSSRYFTLKMQQRSGVFDYIGLGFSNHKDSSDFSTTLEKYFASQSQLIEDIDMVDLEMDHSTVTAPIETGLAGSEPDAISSLTSLNSTDDDNEATSTAINDTLKRHDPVHSEVMEDPSSPLVPTTKFAGTETHSSGAICKSGSLTKSRQIPQAHRYSQLGNFFKCHLCPLSIYHSGDFSSCDFEKPLINHWVEAHGIENPNICRICSLLFESEMEAAKHQEWLHSRKCPMCSLMFSSSTELKKHRSLHNSSCSVTLPKTSQHSDNLILINTTEVIPSQKDQFTSDVQQAPNPTPESMETSVTMNESGCTKNKNTREKGAHNYSQPGNVFKCHLCPLTINHSGDFSSCDFEKPIINHWVQVHGIENPNICSTCSLVFESEIEAAKHIQLQHNFKCQQCTMTLSSAITLRKHMSFHSSSSCSEALPAETEDQSGNLVLESITEVSPQVHFTNDLQQASGSPAGSMETSLDTVNKSGSTKISEREGTASSKLYKLGTASSVLGSNGAHRYSRLRNVFKCHLCPFTTKHTGDFSSCNFEAPIINHWVEFHGIETPSICRKCSLVFDSEMQAAIHFKLQHKFKCQQCSMILPSVNKLIKHVSFHSSCIETLPTETEHHYSGNLVVINTTEVSRLGLRSKEQIQEAPNPSAESMETSPLDTIINKCGGPPKTPGRKRTKISKFAKLQLRKAKRTTEVHCYSQPGNLFQCHLCPLFISHSGDFSSFDMETPIINHWAEVHGIQDANICRMCKLLFHNKRQAFKHVKLRHNYKCKQCSRIFPSETNLNNHQSLPCSSSYSKTLLRTPHNRGNPSLVTGKNRPVEVQGTSAEWRQHDGSSSANLIKPMSSVERRSELFNKYHMYKAAVTYPAGAHRYSQPGNVFKCHLCPLAINHSGDFSSCDFEKPIINHWKEVHRIENPILCRKCSVLFKKEIDADKHVQFLHNNKCHQCSKIFSSATKLKKHVSVRCKILPTSHDNPASLVLPTETFLPALQVQISPGLSQGFFQLTSPVIPNLGNTTEVSPPQLDFTSDFQLQN